MSLNGKGVELSLNVIIIAIIVAVVLITSIAIFSGNIRKSSSVLHENIYSLNHDCDGDGIEDALDKCPCDFNERDNLLPEGCSTPADKCQVMIKEKQCKTDKKED